MEEVADTGERIDRLCGYTIEFLRRVSQPLSHETSHFEVEVAMRIGSHVRVHALHFRLEGSPINGRNGHGHLLSSSATPASNAFTVLRS